MWRDNSGIFRIFGAGAAFPWLPRLFLRSLGGCQQPVSQQRIPGAPIHLALDGLETVNLSLDGTGAPGLGYCGPNSRNVTADACCKGSQFAVRGVLDPLLKAGIIVAAYQCSETSSQVTRLQELRRAVIEMAQELLGLLIEQSRVFTQQPCTVSARRRPPSRICRSGR